MQTVRTEGQPRLSTQNDNPDWYTDSVLQVALIPAGTNKYQPEGWQEVKGQRHLKGLSLKASCWTDDVLNLSHVLQKVALLR